MFKRILKLLLLNGEAVRMMWHPLLPARLAAVQRVTVRANPLACYMSCRDGYQVLTTSKRHVDTMCFFISNWRCWYFITASIRLDEKVGLTSQYNQTKEHWCTFLYKGYNTWIASLFIFPTDSQDFDHVNKLCLSFLKPARFLVKVL